MSTIDLSFSIMATGPIASDHAYHLYSSLCRLLPQLHGSDEFGIHQIRGQQVGNRQLQLCPWSRLVIRALAEKIPELIALSGKKLQILDQTIQVGIPEVHSLPTAVALRSRIVTTKNGVDQERFLKEIMRQLGELQVSSQISVTLGRCRTVRIRDKEVVGHEVILEGLSAEESLNIQEKGLGGRRLMGCGVFVPVTEPRR